METVPVRLIMLLMLLNLKKLVKFTCNTIDMGKILPETNVHQSRFLVLIIKQVFSHRRQFFSIFFYFVYFMCSFNIFHFYITSFSLLYLVQIFGKSFIVMGKLFYKLYGTRCLKPSGTSKTELFVKIISELKAVNYFRKNVRSCCDHVYTKRIQITNVYVVSLTFLFSSTLYSGIISF